MRSLLSRLAIITSLLFATPVLADTPSFGHYQPAPQFDGSVSNSFYLPMRDGVRIAVRVIRPANGSKTVEGRFPVLVHATLSVSQEANDGTGPDAAAVRAMPRLVPHGYVVVIFARRGNGQSFGERRGYHDRNEAQDSYDIIGWAAKQDWSNGKVGMYGCSNTGDAVMQALTTRPPALKAAFAGCFSWHKYDAFRRGGIFAQWGTGPTRTVAEEMAIPAVDGDADKTLLAQAVADHAKATPLLPLWKSLPFRDSWAPLVASRFWEEGSAARYPDQVVRANVPLYIQGGWFDELRDQGLIAHLNIPNSRVVIGPWKHCQNEGFAMLEEAHRFFDQELKGIDTGLDAQPAIHYFTIGAPSGSEWRSTNVWPVANAVQTAWYLSGTSLAATARNAAPFTFTSRTDLSCPEAGSAATVQPCPTSGVGARFTGPALKQDREVTGNGLADLWIATNATDANVFAYLEDVAPDGKVTVVTEGRLKASLRAEMPAPWALPVGVPWHRAYREDATPLTPGKPVRLRFDLLPTSYIFKAGHSIRITVTGTDHRERERDPAVPPAITILADAQHRSMVTLPMVATQSVALPATSPMAH